MKILFIRRDNIGDLVCSTPLFRAARQAFPDARLCALVNSYNAGVVQNHPDLDEVYVYTKAKHRQAGESLIGVMWRRLHLYWRMRQERFDYAIAVGSGYFPHAVKFAKAARPKHIISFTEAGRPTDPAIDLGLERAPGELMHEAADVFRLLAPLGIGGQPPALSVPVDPVLRTQLAGRIPDDGRRRVAVHLSAREASRRWPRERYRTLIDGLLAQGHRVLLLWAPGKADDPRHPGDDEFAESLLANWSDVALCPCPTHSLAELIATLSLAELAVCSDGGTLHIAAAVGLPVVGLFEHLAHKTERWYPWGVPHAVITSGSAEGWQVEHIAADAVLAACQRLLSSDVQEALARPGY